MSVRENIVVYKLDYSCLLSYMQDEPFNMLLSVPADLALIS